MDFETAVNCTLTGVNFEASPWVVEARFEKDYKESFHPLGRRVQVALDPYQLHYQRLSAVNALVPPVLFVVGFLLNPEGVYKVLAVG